ncbi:MaoC family dehydratase [Microbacterium sp. cx-55]|uniref:MaoC family dehydratase n=1 Tax=unclassified Microbacterium TaxID=2609290 RepID=UPI001CBB3E49|nr:MULTISPECIES: MaoC family dehydratase [unclassified Microbacterium]MBZ4488386.1 MaoC family dehydratase [Microbacterium sp. cx-55]MCC4909553.1 MaoC family dehydratase [Microbacterium sp. cx-59]UGB35038.1 MaoC family dehydratase [Microbacterium sp. cx-55]
MTDAARLSLDVAELANAAGASFGPSSWREITQDEVDLFARVTGDHNPIHLDAAYAASTPFGTRIAHGLLTLSLVVPLMAEVFDVPDAGMGINYGLNRVRFPAPVPVGSRIRVVGEVRTASEVPGGVQIEVPVTFEIEGAPKPACVAELVLRYYR